MTDELIAHRIEDGDRTKDVTLQEDINFQAMFLSKEVFEGLSKCGFRKPSPIQLKAIPLGRCGFDLIVKSKSGTGKTGVFSVIALEMIDSSIHDLQVLVLAPTREIAVQISDVIGSIGKYINGLKVSSFIGGSPEKDDEQKAQSCQIAVGAPGRVKSLIKQKILNLESLKLFILDEADKLMEKNFQNDINEIFHKLPDRKQIIATSATYPEELKEFLSNYMQSPTEVSAEIETPLLLGLKQFVKEVKPSSNASQEMKNKNEELLKLLASISFTQCLIFSNYQTRAETISLTLNRNGWNSTFISAAQTQAKRLEAIENLKNFKCRILLATDLLSRGFDASNIDLVINYDIPIDVMTYLHRMGRAGRYGSRGICISLVSGNRDIKKIQTFLGYIGGTNLAISKLSTIDGEEMDLWNTEQKELEQISGIIEKGHEPGEHAIKIKYGVLELKSCKSEIKCEERNKNRQNKDIPNNENENRNVLQIKDTVSSDLVNKNLSSPTNMEGEINDPRDILEAMARGAFDFNNVSDMESSHNTPVENSNLGTIDDKKRKRISDLPDDPKNILESLANKEFDFSKILNIDDLKIASTENIKPEYLEENKKRKTSDSEKGNSKDINEHQNRMYIKNKALYEIAKILTNQVENVGGDTEKNVNSYFNFLQKYENKSLNEFLENSKNTSIDQLLNSMPGLSTFITEQKINEIDTESSDKKLQKRDENLDNIFSHAYRFAIEEKIHWKDLIPEQNIENEEIMDEKNEVSEENEDDDFIETDDNCMEYYDEDYDEEIPGIEYDENGKRIYAYEDIPNRMVWLPVEESVLESNDGCPRENLLENFSENDEEDQIESISFEKIEENTEIQSDPKIYHTNPERAATSFNQTISRSAKHVSNTEESYMSLSSHPLRNFNRDHFTASLAQCSDTLWQEGSRFNSVEDFDNWFRAWQQQVQHVSDYIRQNIYVKEMSEYQNKVRK